MVQAEELPEGSPALNNSRVSHYPPPPPDPYNFTPPEEGENIRPRQQYQSEEDLHHRNNDQRPEHGYYGATPMQFMPPPSLAPKHAGLPDNTGGAVFIDEEHEDAGEPEGKDWSNAPGSDVPSLGREDSEDLEDRLVIAEDSKKDEDARSLVEDEAHQGLKSSSLGLSDEDLAQKLLPDLIRNDLDVLFIGLNPGIYAALKGHHYFGPANHFWKCMLLSGLLPQAMPAEEDYKLLELGIGFTNVVQRGSRTTCPLTRKEIEDGIHSLNEKIRKYSPKIAVFNGKGIYEVYSGKKEFYFGKQPERIPGTDTHIWVLPNSSSRCAQFPSAVEKVPFYASLKKYRDYVKGLLHEDLSEEEFIFKDLKVRSYHHHLNHQLNSPPLMESNGGMNPGIAMGQIHGNPLHQPLVGNTSNSQHSFIHNNYPTHPHQLHAAMHPTPGGILPTMNNNNNNNDNNSSSFHPVLKRDHEFDDPHLMYSDGGDYAKYGPPYPGGNMETYYQYYDVDPLTGKKRRGRPPKPRTDGTMPPPKRKSLDTEGNPIRRGSNPIDPLTGKKKRGRPKKTEEEGAQPKAPKKPTKKQLQQQQQQQQQQQSQQQSQQECQEKANGGPQLGGVLPTSAYPHIPPSQQQPPLQPLPPFSPNFGRAPMEEEKKGGGGGDEGPKDIHHPHLHHPFLEQAPHHHPHHNPYEEYNQYPPGASYPPPYATSGYPTQQLPYDNNANNSSSAQLSAAPTTTNNNNNISNNSNANTNVTTTTNNSVHPGNGGTSNNTPPGKESPEDVSSKSITGLESLVEQIPALENESGVFSAGSHPATPRSVGPYSPVPGNGYAYGSPGHYGATEYHHPPESSPSYPNGNSERASPSTNSSNFSVSSLVTSPPSSETDFSVSNLATSSASSASSASSNSSCSSNSSNSSNSSSSASSGYHTDTPTVLKPEPTSNNKYYPTSSYGMMYGSPGFPPTNPHHYYHGQYHPPPPTGYGGPSSHAFSAPHPPPPPQPIHPQANSPYHPYHYGHTTAAAATAAAASAYPHQTPYF